MFWAAKRTYGPCSARPAGVAWVVGRPGGRGVGSGFVMMGEKVGGKLATDPHARTSSAVVRIVAAVALGICPPLVELTPRPISLSIRGRQATAGGGIQRSIRRPIPPLSLQGAPSGSEGRRGNRLNVEIATPRFALGRRRPSP